MRPNRTLWLVAVIGVLVIAVVGCGNDGSDDTSSSTSSSSPSSPPATAAGTPLAGTQWALSDATNLGVPTAGVSVTAEFGDDGRMSGSSGCNTYTAPYRASGSNLTIGPDIAGSKIACERAVAAVEDVYIARLPQVKSFEISGKTLTLRGTDGETLLAYEASDGAGAIVGKWIATSYFTGTAIQSVIIGSTLTADFEADQVSGDSGCNSFSGPSAVTGSTIKLGPFQSTLKACADPALQTQEQQYLAALELAAISRVTGDRLELLRQDGAIAVTFEQDAAIG